MPGRADYIHHLADLLAEDNRRVVPREINVLDVGCGANLIYPLIGHSEYQWRFTGSEVNEQAMAGANGIIAANPGLNRAIRLRRQKDPKAIFNGVIHKSDFYQATLCNPPFHASAEEAHQGSQRKLRNLGLDRKSPLNFGGQQDELWCEGGEVAFILRMIEESVSFARQCVWFTTLVSRKEHLPELWRALEEADVAAVRTIDMAQGRNKAALSPGLLWNSHSALSYSANNALLRCRQCFITGGTFNIDPALHHLHRLVRCLNACLIKVLLHHAIQRETHRPLLQWLSSKRHAHGK